jgi:hypothetical protein
MTKTIYIRGLPRSGTNLLEYVLKENFDVNVKSGSKHGIIPIPDNKDICLCYITKHPVDWVLSLYAYGYKRPDSLFRSSSLWPNFVYTPLIMLTGPKGMWFRTPVDVWNCYHSHYSTWHNAIHIKLEDFTINTLNMLQKRWALKRTSEKLVWSRYSMNTNATPTGQMFRKRKRKGMITPEIKEWVMSQVDTGIYQRHGYGEY